MATRFPPSPSPASLLKPTIPPLPATPPPPASSSSSPPPSSSLSPPSTSFNVSTFLTENWKLALGVAIVGLITTGAIFWATSKKDQKEKKKKDKKGKKEEKREKEEKKEKEKEEKREKREEKAEEEKPVDINSMTKEEKAEAAKRAKDLGNKYFQGKRYDKAIELYSEALRYLPDSAEAAVFYSNRAACYNNLGEHEKVIEDCSAALGLDKTYVKALNRRAVAYESLHKYEEALVDTTAACILDEFKNETALRNADRIIKILGNRAAADYLPNKKFHLPAGYFLTAYFDSFRNKYELKISSESNLPGDEIYKEAISKLEKKEFTLVFDLVEEAINKGTNSLPQALNLRGTFKYLQGDFEGALGDLTQAIEKDPSASNSYIKRASVLFEKKEPSLAFADFDKAAEIRPNDPDVYYHRGQANFISGNLDGALSDYNKSIELDSNVPFVHVQLGVIYFRMQMIQMSLEIFQNTLEKFPDYGDVYNYYGEVLTEIQRYEDAAKNFDKALEKNPTNPLSMINKAFLIARWKDDQQGAIDLLQKATAIDPMCELAYAHLGQLHIQSNNLEAAIASYLQAVECSRTEPEIAQWFSCIEAAKAQKVVFDLYPEIKAAAKK